MPAFEHLSIKKVAPWNGIGVAGYLSASVIIVLVSTQYKRHVISAGFGVNIGEYDTEK